MGFFTGTLVTRVPFYFSPDQTPNRADRWGGGAFFWPY